MESLKLTQWCVTVDGTEMAMFTPRSSSEEYAMACAVAQFGSGVTALKDEGFVRQELSPAQLHIADPSVCAVCGMYKMHDEDCAAVRASEVSNA